MPPLQYKSGLSSLTLGLTLIALVGLYGCAGKSPQSTPSLSTISVSLQPSSISLAAGTAQTLSVIVSGTSNATVTWAVQESGGGMIGGVSSNSATYIAPITPGIYHVVVTSQADTNKSAVATVTVTAAMSFVISPSSNTMAQGTNILLNASTPVNWSVQESGGGALANVTSTSVVYSAPWTKGVYHVIATSQSDTTQKVVAPITVVDLNAEILPATATALVNSTFPFSITLYSWSYSVTPMPWMWSIQEGNSGGALTLDAATNAKAVYSAPATPGTYHVVAAIAGGPVLSATVSVVSQISAGTFVSTGTMTEARFGHTATQLPDGRVFVAGGESTDDGIGDFSDAFGMELFSTSTSQFVFSHDTEAFNPFHSATLLGSGKVLLAGGYDTGYNSLRSALLFDSASGNVQPAGNMVAGRYWHTATLMSDGRVLVAGGCDTLRLEHDIGSAEIYDPGSNSFTATGSMAQPRVAATATLLPSGKVLIAGGESFPNAPLSSAELYDPTSRSFQPTGSMTVAREFHTATLLPNGKVLIVGGGADARAELYDPASGAFTPTGAMMVPRQMHTATLLQDGTVLIAGGQDGNLKRGVLDSAEIYAPATGTFTRTGSMRSPRLWHTATLLLDGNVLITGGEDPGSSGVAFSGDGLRTAELYIFKAVGP